MLEYNIRTRCVFLIVLLNLMISCKAEEIHHKTAVIGYMPEYRLGGGYKYQEAFENGLTHVIFFSLEVSPTTFLPTALDRLPPPNIMKEAREAADRVGGKLLLCFGGNARTGGFPGMVTSKASRATFLKALDELLKTHGFDGVDYNWEYPTNEREWKGLVRLMKESRSEMLLGGHAIVTAAFYPDPNQYGVIQRYKLHEVCHFLLSMSYDNVRDPQGHSTYELAQYSIQAWRQHGLPMDRLAVGVPFYGRDVHTGDPETYADLLKLLVKQIPDRSQRDSTDRIGNQIFNGPAMMRRKTELAVREGVHIMIWELGQDVSPPSHESGLLAAIGGALKSVEDSGLGARDDGKVEL